MNIDDTIAPNSDQIGAEDFLAGPRTVVVKSVTRGSAEQPVDIHLEEFDRPWRPCKSMRRVLVSCWGPDASAYVGRRLTLFRDPQVRFGGLDTGGVRIAALSHIEKRVTLALTVTRGRRAPFTVEPLRDVPPPTPDRLGIGALFDKAGIPKDRADDRMIVTRKIIGREVAKYADLSADEVDQLHVQLTTWDLGGELVDKVTDILDFAAIEAEQEGEK